MIRLSIKFTDEHEDSLADSYCNIILLRTGVNIVEPRISNSECDFEIMHGVTP